MPAVHQWERDPAEPAPRERLHVEVLGHRQVREGVQLLVDERHAGRRGVPRVAGRVVDSVHRHPPRVRPVDAAKEVHQRGLARPVFAAASRPEWRWPASAIATLKAARALSGCPWVPA